MTMNWLASAAASRAGAQRPLWSKLKASNPGELADLIPDLERRKQRYDKLAATHNSRRDNPVRTHTRFWLELMALWRSLDEAGQQHKHFREFLSICSKPIFPKATTETTLTSFIERYFPQTNA
jgi:hypothetical protein